LQTRFQTTERLQALIFSIKSFLSILKKYLVGILFGLLSLAGVKAPANFIIIPLFEILFKQISVNIIAKNQY